MVKQFTFRDLLKYNRPCKVCDSKTSLAFQIDENFGSAFPSRANANLGFLPYVENNRLHVNLNITYKNSLKIVIVPESNMYASSDNKIFANYLKNKQMYCEIQCKICGTTVVTNFLKFSQQFIKPITIFEERLFIRNDGQTINIYSYYNNDVIDGIEQTPYTTLYNYKINNACEQMTLPLLSLHEFKNREELEHKIKFWLTYS